MLRGLDQKPFKNSKEASKIEHTRQYEIKKCRLTNSCGRNHDSGRNARHNNAVGTLPSAQQA